MINVKMKNLTIVSSQKGIPILVLELSIDILFCLFNGDVHVTIQTGQNTCIKGKNKVLVKVSLPNQDIKKIQKRGAVARQVLYLCNPHQS